LYYTGNIFFKRFFIPFASDYTWHIFFKRFFVPFALDYTWHIFLKKNLYTPCIGL
jgi:hypothetical protein